MELALDYALFVTWQQGRFPEVLGSANNLAASHMKGRVGNIFQAKGILLT